MTFSRIGSGKNSEDSEALKWLEEQAAKGEISDEEFQEALKELENNMSQVNVKETYELMRERYKREKAREGFESGVGGFKRST